MKAFSSGDMLVHKDLPIDEASMAMYGEQFYKLEVAVLRKLTMHKGVRRFPTISDALFCTSCCLGPSRPGHVAGSRPTTFDVELLRWRAAAEGMGSCRRLERMLIVYFSSRGSVGSGSWVARRDARCGRGLPCVVGMIVASGASTWGV